MAGCKSIRGPRLRQRVASTQGLTSCAETQCECCASRRSPARSAQLRQPRSSNPGRDRPASERRHRGEVQFGSRVVSGPTSPCDPSSRQAYQRDVSFHCILQRAKKRIAAESVKIEQAEKQRQLFEEELAQAERDLEGFRREAETSAGGSGPCRESQDPVAVLEAELSQARAELAQLKGGVDPDASCGPSVKRPCRTGEVRGGVPAMPTLVQLNMWLEERHADFHDALLQGDSYRALELTAKLSDGVEQMVEMTDGMHP